MASDRPQPSPLAALVALHIAVALFGFAGLFGKWLVLAPVVIVLGRTVVAAAALAVVVHLRRSDRRPTTALAVNGAVLALHWVSFFAAIQVSTVAIGLLGYASFPLFVLIIERRVVGRRWSSAEAATAALVTAGLLLLVPWTGGSDGTLYGLAWGLVSGFTFALLAVRNRALSREHSPAAIALWQNGFAALCLLALLPFQNVTTSLTGRDIALILVLGLMCTALAHTLFISSLQRLSAHTASIVSALEPVYGIALAAALLVEIPGTLTLAGATLIVSAAVIASRRVER